MKSMALLMVVVGGYCMLSCGQDAKPKSKIPPHCEYEFKRTGYLETGLEVIPWIEPGGNFEYKKVPWKFIKTGDCLERDVKYEEKFDSVYKINNIMYISGFSAPVEHDVTTFESKYVESPKLAECESWTSNRIQVLDFATKTYQIRSKILYPTSCSCAMEERWFGIHCEGDVYIDE